MKTFYFCFSVAVLVYCSTKALGDVGTSYSAGKVSIESAIGLILLLILMWLLGFMCGIGFQEKPHDG